MIQSASGWDPLKWKINVLSSGVSTEVRSFSGVA